MHVADSKGDRGMRGAKTLPLEQDALGRDTWSARGLKPSNWHKEGSDRRGEADRAERAA